MSASEKLASWIETSGMLKTEVAKKLEVTPSLITHYTSGRRSPSRILAKAIEQISEGAVPASLWHEPKPPLPKGSQMLLDWMVEMRATRRRTAKYFKVSVGLVNDAVDGKRCSPKLLENLKDWGPLAFDALSEKDFQHAG